MTTRVLLILTAAPHNPLAMHGLKLAEAICKNQHAQLATFFYQDAVHVANAYTWQPADKMSVTAAWQALAQTHALTFPVCVSAALARGVTNMDNAKRHQIYMPSTHLETDSEKLADNLAEHFELVGLGDLAEKMHWADKVIRL